jgi:FAD/FMN-containing dehydrogenase
VLRFGPMRAQLRGIEAVLADGTVLSHLAGLVKDNTGYDYPSLLAGSEGTLAVITAARIWLVPRLRDTVTALAGLSGLDEVHALARSSASRSSSTFRYPPRSGCGSHPGRRPWSPTWTRELRSLPSYASPTETCT